MLVQELMTRNPVTIAHDTSVPDALRLMREKKVRRLPVLDSRVDARLADLSRHLGRADWLDGDFSAGELMMTSVLLRL